MARWTWLALASAVVLLTAAVAVFRTKPAVDITAVEVTSGTVTRRIFTTGALQATRTVQVGTQVSGTVASLGADFNSIVRKGQVVARLEPSLYQAALDQANGALQQSQAALAQARADLAVARTVEDDARIKLGRAEDLAAGQLTTAADLDAAQIAMNEAVASVASAAAQVKDAAAGVDQAKAAVEQANVNLSHTVISSPIDGIVLNRAVDVGQTVAAAVQAPVLFTIATDLTRLQVQVDVDQSEVGGIEVGYPVTFEVESYPDETFRGVVSQVRLQPIAEQSTSATTVASSTIAQQTASLATVVSYATMIDVENPDARLRPGMTASVALNGLRRDNVVRVPNAALSFRPSVDVLRTLGESEPAVPQDRAAEAGQRGRELWTYDGKRLMSHLAQFGLSDAQWTEIVNGAVHPGERIVTNAVVRRP